MCYSLQPVRHSGLCRQVRAFGLFALAVLAISAAADEVHAQIGVLRSWTNSAGGNYNDPFNWDTFVVPGANDGAAFGLAATYTVDFPSNQTASSARATNGSVTWDLDSSGAARTYTLGALTVGGSSGPKLIVRDGTVNAGTVRVQNTGHLQLGPTDGINHPPVTLNISGDLQINTGGQLTLSDFFSNHVLNASGNVLIDAGKFRRSGSDSTSTGGFNLAAGRSIIVQNGGEFSHGGVFRLTQGQLLHVTSGGTITADGLDIASSAGNGTLIAEGIGSSVIMDTQFAPMQLQTWGAGGHSAMVEIRSGATGELEGGLLMATDGSASTATLTVDGPGTVFEHTLVGSGGAPDQIIVGHASTGSAVINIQNGAVFTSEAGVSGSSRFIVNATGQVNIGSGALLAARTIEMNGGQFNALGGTVRFGEFRGNFVNQGATLIPGHLTGNSAFIEGNYTQQSAASLQVEIGGIIPGQWDQVLLAGNATLNGMIKISLTDGFVPVVGNSFTILETVFGNVGGKFATVEGSLPMPGLGLAVTYGAKTVTVVAALPGDANLDGSVTISDLGILAGNWQQSGQTWIHADFNGDGSVTIADLGVLAGNWQAGTGGIGFQEALRSFEALRGVVVPEPSAWVLMMIGGGFLLSRRRGRRAGRL